MIIFLTLLSMLFLSPEPVDEACSTVHGAGSCCRIVSEETVSGSTPIERIVCGDQ